MKDDKRPLEPLSVKNSLDGVNVGRLDMPDPPPWNVKLKFRSGG